MKNAASDAASAYRRPVWLVIVLSALVLEGFTTIVLALVVRFVARGASRDDDGAGADISDVLDTGLRCVGRHRYGRAARELSAQGGFESV
jgi:hypothetical protein